MFTVFLSKLFITNIYNEENQSSSKFELFNNDFFPKLSVLTLICDFDIETLPDHIKMKIINPLLNDGWPFKVVHFSTSSLEEAIIHHYNRINEFNAIDFEKLFLIHLPISTYNSYKHLQQLSIISSLDFEGSFNLFLLSGKLENSTTQYLYFNYKKDFNPFYCSGNNIVLIDDAYFLVKRADKIVDEKIKNKHYKKQIEDLIDTFIEPELAIDKKIIFYIPTHDHDERKLSWSKQEQDELRNMASEVVLRKMPTAKIYLFFHNLKTHARKVLTNKHFYKLDLGFDFIKLKNNDATALEQMVESIEFKSIFLKNPVLSEYMRIRIYNTKTKAIKHF